MGDRRAEGALALGPLDVDVDPLVIAGDAGEGVDVLLGDGAPIRGTDLPADQLAHALDAVDLDSRHQSVHQSWTISPSPSWRAPQARTSMPSSPASQERVTPGATRIASRVSTSTISSSSLKRPLPLTIT